MQFQPDVISTFPPVQFVYSALMVNVLDAPPAKFPNSNKLFAGFIGKVVAPSATSIMVKPVDNVLSTLNQVLAAPDVDGFAKVTVQETNLLGAS